MTAVISYDTASSSSPELPSSPEQQELQRSLRALNCCLVRFRAELADYFLDSRCRRSPHTHQLPSHESYSADPPSRIETVSRISQEPHCVTSADMPPPLSTQALQASSLWTAAKSFEICKEGEEALFEGKIQLLDTVSSVEMAVSRLNADAREFTDEFCVVFAKSCKAYHVLYKAGKKHLAMEKLGMVNRMHGTLSVRIIAAHHLRNSDSGVFGDVSDPFAVARFGTEEYKTKRINNSLNPVWNVEPFRFHVDTAQQTSKKLRLEVFDADKSLGSLEMDIWAMGLASGEVLRKREKLANGDEGEIDFEISFRPEQHSEVLSDVVEKLKLELKRQYGSVVSICIVGGVSFGRTDTEEIVQKVAEALHTSFAGEAVFVTEGTHGVQETFAKHCGDGSRVWNLLPVDSEGSGFANGIDIFAGENLDERKVIFGMLGDIYITAEGGPDTARKACAAVGRGACVVPLIRTGGASDGLFDFPAEALRKPECATEDQWAALKDRSAPPSITAAAVTSIVASYLEARGLRRRPVDLPIPLTPSSRKELSAEVALLTAEVARHSVDLQEDITPKVVPSRVGISGVGRLEAASPVSKGKRVEIDSFESFGGREELRALIVEFASRNEVPHISSESIQDVWINNIVADTAQIGAVYHVPPRSSGTHGIEHSQFILERDTSSETQRRWRVVRMLQPQVESPTKTSPKRKAPPPLDDSLTNEQRVAESLEEGDDDASSLVEAVKHCIEITDAARTPRALFANFASLDANSNLMISRETFAQLVAMYGGRSPAVAGGEKLASALFETLSVSGPDGVAAVPYDIFCAELCPARAHDAVLRLQGKRNALLRDLQAAASASCLPLNMAISGIVGDRALDEERFNRVVIKMLKESDQPEPDRIATKALWCELVRGQSAPRAISPQKMSQLLAGQCTLEGTMPRSSPRAAPAPLDVDLADDDHSVVQTFGKTDAVASSHEVAPHIVLREAMRFGATLDTRSPRDLFDTVSTSAGGAGSALTISRDDFVPFAARLGGGNALHAPAPSLDVGSVSTDKASHILFDHLAIKDANGDRGVHYEIFVTEIYPEGAPEIVVKSSKIRNALLRDLRAAVRSASREPAMRMEDLVGEGPLDENLFNDLVKKILGATSTSSLHGPVASKLLWLELVKDRLQPDCRLNSKDLISILTARDPSASSLLHSNTFELSSDDDSSMELGQTAPEMVVDDITPFATPQHGSITSAKQPRDFVTSLEKAVAEATEAEYIDEEKNSPQMDTAPLSTARQIRVMVSQGSQMAGGRYKGVDMRVRKMERSVRAKEREHGTSHPETAHALLSLASHHEKHGFHANHKAHHDRAMSIYEQCFGSDHKSLVDGLSAHADIVKARGERDVEELLRKRIQSIQETSPKTDVAGLLGDHYDRCGIRRRNEERLKQSTDRNTILSPTASNLSASMLLSSMSPCGASGILKEALFTGLASPSSEKAPVVPVSPSKDPASTKRPPEESEALAPLSPQMRESLKEMGIVSVSLRDDETENVLKPLADDFDEQKLRSAKILASDLDKTLYPNGMGNATTDPKPEAREDFDKNIYGFMDFIEKGGLAIPVTGNNPAMAQRKFDRSRVTWNVEEHPGVFCNGALILGVKGVVEYSAPVPSRLMKQLQEWVARGDGFFDFQGNRYAFAVNCMTKSKVLYLPPKAVSPESPKIADGWASMQLMTSDIADLEFDWEKHPAYQVNVLLKSKADLLQEFPALEEDNAGKINKIQTALLDKLEEQIGKLDAAGCQGKHVLQPWCETNIVVSGVNKGQSLNRFIHCKSVKDKIGVINVGTEVMVAGDAANDLPMFVEWSQVDDFNGETLAKTERPGIRIIMPDAEDEKLSKESNLKNKVHEVLAAIPIRDPLSPLPFQEPTEKPVLPATRLESWLFEQSIDLCNVGEEELFEGKVTLLEKNTASSIKMAVQSLNHGLLACEDGYCIVLDIAQSKYFLIYQVGKREAALACFGLKDSAEGKVTLTIHGATHLKNVDSGILGDVSDPFVVARISLEEQKTETIYNNTDPVWKKNEFEFKVDMSREDDKVLVLEVFDHNNFRSNKSLGTANVNLTLLQPDITKKLTLELKDGEGAKVSLSVRLSPDVIQADEPQQLAPAELPKENGSCGVVSDKSQPLAPAELPKDSGKLVGLSPLHRPNFAAVFADADADKDDILGPADLNMYLCNYLGYGRAEVAAFRREFGDENGVGMEGLKKGVKSLSPYAINQASGRLFLRKPGAFGGMNEKVDFALGDLNDCTVLLCEQTAALTADHLTNCRVLLGPCSSAIFLRNCENCVFYTACKQFRCRDCKNCDFYVHSKTEPIIEKSEGLRFAPFAASYPGLTRHFKDAKLHETNNFWSAIYDFTGKPDRSNWSFLPLDDCETLTVSWGSDETPENPCPSLTQELLTAEAPKSEEEHGQSVTNTPQTRPPPPPPPVRGSCRQRCITDEADSLKEGAISAPAIASTAKSEEKNEEKVVGSRESCDWNNAIRRMQDQGRCEAGSSLDDDVEIEILDESDSAHIASKATSNFRAFNKVSELLRKGDDDDDDDDVQASTLRTVKRTSPSGQHTSSFRTAARMAAGADDDSSDNDLPLGRTLGKSAVAKPKAPSNSPLAKKMQGIADSDSDGIGFHASSVKPVVKSALGSLLTVARGGDDSDDDVPINYTNPRSRISPPSDSASHHEHNPRDQRLLERQYAKARARKAAGQRSDSDTSDSDGVDARKWSSSAAARR